MSEGPIPYMVTKVEMLSWLCRITVVAVHVSIMRNHEEGAYALWVVWSNSLIIPLTCHMSENMYTNKLIVWA